jgi:hypothetical protein
VLKIRHIAKPKNVMRQLTRRHQHIDNVTKKIEK